MTRVTVTKGSGNVFRDLGFSEEKSAELILKSSLLQALQETIKDRSWKQVETRGEKGPAVWSCHCCRRLLCHHRNLTWPSRPIPARRVLGNPRPKPSRAMRRLPRWCTIFARTLPA